LRILAVIILVGSLCTSAWAENKEIAREAFHQGTLQYDLGEFKAALANFKKAYLNYEDPAFLFNIAQCQRQLGDKAEALRTYRVFLMKVPSSRQRPQVEKIINDLQAAIEQEKAAVNRPPTGTIAPEPQATPPPPPETAKTGPGKSEAALTATAPRREKPLVKKAWFWGAVAGGAVVVAGAITLGVVLGRSGKSYVELTY
jgi:tetratricopeptide (TPR) repeat protein